MCALSEAGSQSKPHTPTLRPGPASVLQGPCRYTRGARRPALRGCGGVGSTRGGRPAQALVIDPSAGGAGHVLRTAQSRTPLHASVLSAGRQPEPSRFPAGQGKSSDKFQSHTKTLPQALCMYACVHTHHACTRVHVDAHVCTHKSRAPPSADPTLKGHTAPPVAACRWALPLLAARSPAGHFGHSWDKMGSPVSSLGEHPQKQPPQCNRAGQDLQHQALTRVPRRGRAGQGPQRSDLRCFLGTT